MGAEASLLDHLVGNGEQRWRHGEAQHPGGLVIDDKLELGRLQDRQVRRLLAFEDAAGIDADLTPPIRNAGAITNQPADFGKLTRPRGRGECVARRQVDQLGAPAIKKDVEGDEDGVGPLAHKSGEGRIDLAALPPRAEVDRWSCHVRADIIFG